MYVRSWRQFTHPAARNSPISGDNYSIFNFCSSSTPFLLFPNQRVGVQSPERGRGWSSIGAEEISSGTLRKNCCISPPVALNHPPRFVSKAKTHHMLSHLVYVVDHRVTARDRTRWLTMVTKDLQRLNLSRLVQGRAWQAVGQFCSEHKVQPIRGAGRTGAGTRMHLFRSAKRNSRPGFGRKAKPVGICWAPIWTPSRCRQRYG